MKKRKIKEEEKILQKKKMTKKEYLELQKSQRSAVGQMMNTGTKTMKSKKDYNRKENKKIEENF